MPRGIPIQAPVQGPTQAPIRASIRERALRRALIPFVAVAFLLAQLLVGFHHHSDVELKRGDGHLPAAECTLCLAAHLPFDVAEEFELSVPGEVVAKRVSFLAFGTHPAPLSPQHQPRAPPVIS